jgi:hypothetical protein
MEVLSEYGEGILRDFLAWQDYKEKYEGLINDLTSDINDLYLKANNQEEGIESYGRMVALLLADYRAANEAGAR